MSTVTDDGERQPLLQGSQPTESISTSVLVADPETPTDADAAKPDSVERTTDVWTVLWYIILVSGGTLALVFFIKGFIDAGDVDVSLL
jgi:hypothetical protein